MKINKYINRSSFIFNYEKIDNIPAKIYNNNYYSELTERFEEPVTNPAIEQNDELPETLAILKSKSKGGYSHFLVSPVKTVLKSNYDGDYTINPQKCIENFTEKVDLLTKLLSEAISKAGVNFKFGGLTFLIKIVLDDFEGCENSIDYMCKNFFHININGANLTDSDFRFSVEKDGFFINFTFGHILAVDSDEKEMNLCVEIDINDICNYNKYENKSDYRFNSDKIHRMIELLGKSIEAIDNIVEKREVDFNEFDK